MDLVLAPARPQDQRVEFGEDFSGLLDEKIWRRFQVNDFKEWGAERVEVGGGTDFRLGLWADTRKTDDQTVKYVGVRTVAAFDFRRGKRFSVKIDWNNQANSAYLTAALYLCPTVTSGNPREEPDWFKFEYIGIPTQNTVRMAIARKKAGLHRFLERGGWPKVKKGQVIHNSEVQIILDAADLVVVEQGKERYRKSEHGLGFTKAYLYLVLSSHSNYYKRTILFDDVIVTPAEVPR